MFLVEIIANLRFNKLKFTFYLVLMNKSSMLDMSSIKNLEKTASIQILLIYQDSIYSWDLQIKLINLNFIFTYFMKGLGKKNLSQ